MTAPLAYTAATELCRMVRARQLSPVELIRGTLERIETCQPTLNGFITVCADEAMDAAQRAEQAVVNGDELGPLHGIPFTVKDLIDTEGVRTTMGSYILEHHVPRQDAI